MTKQREANLWLRQGAAITALYSTVRKNAMLHLLCQWFQMVQNDTGLFLKGEHTLLFPVWFELCLCSTANTSLSANP